MCITTRGYQYERIINLPNKAIRVLSLNKFNTHRVTFQGTITVKGKGYSEITGGKIIL